MGCIESLEFGVFIVLMADKICTNWVLNLFSKLLIRSSIEIGFNEISSCLPLSLKMEVIELRTSLRVFDSAELNSPNNFEPSLTMKLTIL